MIALLNSYSGLAACATGFVIGNNVLIMAGALVGASALILTNIMCKAMNRSLTSVMFATLGKGGGGSPPEDEVYAGKIKSTSAEEVAMPFDGARRVVIVPGDPNLPMVLSNEVPSEEGGIGHVDSKRCQNRRVLPLVCGSGVVRGDDRMWSHYCRTGRQYGTSR